MLTVQLAPQGDAQGFWNTVVERIEVLPGVAAVGLTNAPPMDQFNTSLHVFPVGPDRLATTESVQTEWCVVSADCFRAVGMPIRHGLVLRAE